MLNIKLTLLFQSLVENKETLVKLQHQDIPRTAVSRFLKRLFLDPYKLKALF